MQLKKLSTPSLKELFVSELENKIISGELKVGEKLPSERELSELMHVSRTVVGAGIAELEQKGFVIIKPRVGTFVEDYRRNGTLDAFVSIMRHNDGSLSRDEINSILQLRIVLVTLGCELAIENCTDKQLKQLSDITDKLSTDMTDDTIIELTFSLYHELACICGNKLLPLLFVSFKDLVCRLWRRYILNYGKSALIENDKKLVALVLLRDIDGAREHISHSTNEAISDERIYRNMPIQSPSTSV